MKYKYGDWVRDKESGTEGYFVHLSTSPVYAGKNHYVEIITDKGVYSIEEKDVELVKTFDELLNVEKKGTLTTKSRTAQCKEYDMAGRQLFVIDTTDKECVIFDRELALGLLPVLLKFIDISEEQER